MKYLVKAASYLIVLFVLQIGTTNAGTIEGKWRNGNFNWQSAVESKNGIAPALWDLPMSQPVGDRLIPGGISGVSTGNAIGMVNDFGDMLVMPITLEGVQYLVNDAATITDDTSGTNTEISGDIVTVLGSGSGNKVIHFDREQSMIKSYRPIISINKAMLDMFLDGNEEGRYTGTASIPFEYDLYRNNVRIRQIAMLSLRMSVTFNRASIHDAVITSGHEGVLTAKYHGHPDLVVSALGHYGVRITGDFSHGLRANVENFVGTSFVLTNPDDATSEIPYSVSCASGCLSGNQEFIDDGHSSDAFVQIDNSNDKEANIILKVGFNDKPYDELVPGTYQGHFKLIFEAEL